VPLPLVGSLVEDYPHVEAVLLVDVNPALLGQYVAASAARPRADGVISLILQAHALGAAGALCTEANVAPALVPSIWAALEAGDLAGAEAGYRRLLAVAAPIARYGNPRSLKEALRAIGRDWGT
jgi:dihydrodipicolinate synthase/N-acetylneuraminate lyase